MESKSFADERMKLYLNSDINLRAFGKFFFVQVTDAKIEQVVGDLNLHNFNCERNVIFVRNQ